MTGRVPLQLDPVVIGRSSSPVQGCCMLLSVGTARLPPVESTGLPDSGRSTGEALFAEAPAVPPGSGRADAARGVPARAAVGSWRTRAARALLAAAAAVLAAGCASHLARPAPAPAPPVAGRCGVEPGICLLGVPAPLDEGGQALGWRCLGLHGGADAACALPVAAAPQASAAGDEMRRPRATVLAALETAAVTPVRLEAAGAPEGGAQPVVVPPRTRGEIAALLAAKAERTPAQRKVGSRLLELAAAAPVRGSRQPLPQDQRRSAQGVPAAEGVPAQGPAGDDRALVDIRAEVTPAVLARIRELGGTVVSSVPRYGAVRARLPLPSVERLAALDAVRTLRTADEARTRRQVAPRTRAAGAGTRDPVAPRKVDTSAGDVALRANRARWSHGIDGDVGRGARGRRGRSDDGGAAGADRILGAVCGVGRGHGRRRLAGRAVGLRDAERVSGAVGGRGRRRGGSWACRDGPSRGRRRPGPGRRAARRRGARRAVRRRRLPSPTIRWCPG